MEKQKCILVCEGDPELSMTRNCRVHCSLTNIDTVTAGSVAQRSPIELQCHRFLVQFLALTRIFVWLLRINSFGHITLICHLTLAFLLLCYFIKFTLHCTRFVMNYKEVKVQTLPFNVRSLAKEFLDTLYERLIFMPFPK